MAARGETSHVPRVSKARRLAVLPLEEHLGRTHLLNARTGCILVCLLTPAGVLLDYLCHPQFLGFFLVIRLAIAGLAVVVWWASHGPRAEAYPVLLGALLAIAAVGGIEIMITKLGPYSSGYIAGLNLVILGVGVVYTWSWKQCAVFCLGTVVLWLTCGVLFVERVSFAVFFSHLSFLGLISVVATYSAAARQKLTKAELTARFNLASTSQELESTLDKLRGVEPLKNEFFQNISHELRTPLTLVLAPLEELIGRTEDDTISKMLKVVRENAKRLLRLIDDLLDLSKLETGGLRLAVAQVDLPILLDKLVEIFAPTAATRGVRLSFENQGTPTNAYGDPHRLEMVFTNLLANALKFTPKDGHIKITLESNGSGIIISVADSGPGIPAEELSHIFDRFYQIRGASSERLGGVGIGLSLAYELVQLHGGKLTVESALGQGSVFRVVLPTGNTHFPDAIVERRIVQRDHHKKRRAEDRFQSEIPSTDTSDLAQAALDLRKLVLEHGRTPTILIAEDNVPLREFMEQIFEDAFDVKGVSKGSEAFHFALETAPDIIVSDVMMPEMTGTELCRKIKQHPTLAKTPFVLLTALTGTEAYMQAASAGADEFLTKPFHPRFLISRVTHHLRVQAMTAQLVAQSKIATASVLAAGLAHEVKNPLNAIINSARAITGSEPLPQEAIDKLKRLILEGAERILDIVSALDNFVRPADGSSTNVCEIAEGIESVRRLHEPRLREVELQITVDGSPKIMASSTKLHQVISNLVDNAISVGASKIWINATTRDAKVHVVVADNGPGVPPQLRDKIFDPMFTTRPVGDGQGFGLSICSLIVREFGGTIAVSERQGGGAAFSLAFPVAHAQDDCPSLPPKE